MRKVELSLQWINALSYIQKHRIQCPSTEWWDVVMRPQKTSWLFSSGYLGSLGFRGNTNRLCCIATHVSTLDNPTSFLSISESLPLPWDLKITLPKFENPSLSRVVRATTVRLPHTQNSCLPPAQSFTSFFFLLNLKMWELGFSSFNLSLDTSQKIWIQPPQKSKKNN